MFIRRFEGTELREVLRQVREELGPDALVLSTRYPRKGKRLFGGLARPCVEVTAAVDRDPGAAARAAAPKPTAAPDASWNELRVTRALVRPLEEELRSLREAVDRLQGDGGRARSSEWDDELAALRAVARELRGAKSAGEPSGVALEAGLAPRHGSLVQGDTSEEACASLARNLEGALSPPRPDAEGPTLFVGTAGVGKTTTLAKVTARIPEPPALLSLDVHRVGAEAPLRAWADQRGLAFGTASSPSEAARAIRRFGSRPVLVDTAGCSRGDEDGLRELMAVRESIGDRARVCLVVPATRKEADLRADLERFAGLAPDGLAVTRLDESSALGGLANLLLDGACPPLMWTADGQRVPDDLQVADPAELASKIFGEAA